MSKTTANLIVHTHWDREWYLPLSEFLVDLVSLIDQAIYLLDNTEPEVCFLLDGQTIVIEDYLTIRPENEDKVRGYLKDGRLQCGPWYVLPDELLISGESHIRNYLTASDMSNVGAAYLPDSFGHPEQIPQIVSGLGLDGMLFWRGMPLALKRSEFMWQSPCPGHGVFCVHMPSGYGNSAQLGQGEIVERLNGLIRRLREDSGADAVLLMNGSDHIAPQLDIAFLVDYFNRESDEAVVRFSTLDRHIKELRSSLSENALEVWKGELRSGERAMLLGGTLSSRMPLKQWNHRVTSAMERYLEPMAALSKLAGFTPFPDGYSRAIWKSILANLPHDSICGCSIDEVHEEMAVRFGKILQMENKLMGLMAKQQAAEESEPGFAWLTAFEPTADGHPCYLEIDVDMDAIMEQYVDFGNSVIVRHSPDAAPHPAGLRMTDEKGREIPSVVLGCKEERYHRIQSHTTPEVFRVNRVRAAVMLPKSDLGYGAICVTRSETQSEQVAHDAGHTIENEFYLIRANSESGDFTLLDKQSGRELSGIHRLTDGGDAGDEYTYSWPEQDKTVLCASCRVSRALIGSIAQKLTVKGSLELPEEISKDRLSRSEKTVSCPFEVTALLVKGQRYVEFHTVFHNSARDHRLQAEYPCGILAADSSSISTFAMTSRSISQPVPEQWREYPQSTHPTHGLACAFDGGSGAAVFMRGLTEYEAENRHGQTILRATLLRCVGWLSRDDLISRKDHGGWGIETPGAQCIGRREFETAFMPFNGSSATGGAIEACDRYLHPVRLFQTRWGKANNAPPFYPVKLPAGIRLSACKLPHSGDGLILRVFNITREPVPATLALPSGCREAFKVNLAEVVEHPLDVRHGCIEITIRPAEIYTVLFK